MFNFDFIKKKKTNAMPFTAEIHIDPLILRELLGAASSSKRIDATFNCAIIRVRSSPGLCGAGLCGWNANGKATDTISWHGQP